MSKRDGVSKRSGEMTTPRSRRVALVQWRLTEDSSKVYEKFYAMPGAAHARAGALREHGAFDVRVYESPAGPWVRV
jgi:hypothetical protein